jgi:hypothetical protein
MTDGRALRSLPYAVEHVFPEGAVAAYLRHSGITVRLFPGMETLYREWTSSDDTWFAHQLPDALVLWTESEGEGDPSTARMTFHVVELTSGGVAGR